MRSTSLASQREQPAATNRVTAVLTRSSRQKMRKTFTQTTHELCTQMSQNSRGNSPPNCNAALPSVTIHRGKIRGTNIQALSQKANYVFQIYTMVLACFSIEAQATFFLLLIVYLSYQNLFCERLPTSDNTHLSSFVTHRVTPLNVSIVSPANRNLRTYTARIVQCTSLADS